MWLDAVPDAGTALAAASDAMAGKHPTADDIRRRAARVVLQNIGRVVEVASPRLCDGLWEVPLVYHASETWVEVGVLRFDGLGRVRPVSWPALYNRIAAAMSADSRVRTIAADKTPVADTAAADLALLMPSSDPITGLPGLQSWYRSVRRHLAGLTRHGEAFCVAWLRLQDLPRLDALVGPRVTDALTALAATRLRAALDERHMLCTSPRGEFALLLEDTLPRATQECAEAIAAATAQPLPLTSAGDVISIDIRAGVVQARPASDSSSLRIRAQAALRRAESSRAAVCSPQGQ